MAVLKLIIFKIFFVILFERALGVALIFGAQEYLELPLCYIFPCISKATLVFPQMHCTNRSFLF